MEDINIDDRVLYRSESESIVTRIDSPLGWREFTVKLENGLIRMCAKFQLRKLNAVADDDNNANDDTSSKTCDGIKPFCENEISFEYDDDDWIHDIFTQDSALKFSAQQGHGTSPQPGTSTSGYALHSATYCSARNLYSEYLSSARYK